MATTKKSTTPKTGKKKASPKKKSTKAKKKTTSKRFSYSSLVIILIALAMFFFLKNKKDSDIIEEINTENTTDSIQNLLFDQYKLDHYYPKTLENNTTLVEHLAYSLAYNEEHEQADWVLYELTKEEVEDKKFPRKDNFKADPSPSISSASPQDYYKSGYDRGHLCPAADNRWSAQAMDQSFYMSNMSPQAPELNRKIWKDLEEQVRDWALQYEKLYIVTGPILNDGVRTKIGDNQVSVPNYYYKVVADLTGDNIKGVGFIFSNGQNNGQLKNFAFPIDMIEERTNIDFFYKLDDDIEKKFETEFKIEDWF